MDHVSSSLSSDLTTLKSVRNYFFITKPGIVGGNLVSVLGGFLLASKGQVDSTLMISILFGVALVIAASCVLNNVFDRDVDQLMSRTCNRALANGQISPHSAELYALVLGLAGIGLLLVFTNFLTVGIVLLGFIIYVSIYTKLKRSSSYAPLVGSLAGATPPLAGYCAVAGQFDTAALILLAIFSLWQMPHFYAIAIYRLDDYRSASIPVLPVKRDVAVTRRHIVGYIITFLFACIALNIAGYTGYWYLVVILISGLSWLFLALTGYKQSTERMWARKLFVFSILMIMIVNIMMAIDFVTPASKFV